MKKIFTLIILLATLQSKSQSFYKGALVIDAGGGLEIYNTKIDIHNKVNGRDTSETDKAGNSHFTFGAEYGLHKKFGVGLRFKSANFFTEKDTVNNVKPTLKSNDFVVQLNYHPVSTKGFDLVLGGDIGYSKLKWELKDKESTSIWSSGLYYSLYVNPRLYIGPFGFNMKLGMPFFLYPKLKSDNENFTKDHDYKLKGSPGFVFSAGIQFRFIENKDKKEETKN
ncbi:MAG: hypothetical protein K0S32_2391 [Bacteroidetes bacterium]|jgi:hypothetical protein|nr:hypothetical protein [Bacteroidota bacterium]